jgi:hypothetical protein
VGSVVSVGVGVSLLLLEVSVGDGSDVGLGSSEGDGSSMGVGSALGDGSTVGDGDSVGDGSASCANTNAALPTVSDTTIVKSVRKERKRRTGRRVMIDLPLVEAIGCSSSIPLYIGEAYLPHSTDRPVPRTG